MDGVRHGLAGCQVSGFCFLVLFFLITPLEYSVRAGVLGRGGGGGCFGILFDKL